MVRSAVRSCGGEYKRREESGVARRDRSACRDERHRAAVAFPLEGALARAPRQFPGPDEHGKERLRRLDECLAVIQRAFPGVETGVRLCRLSCELLEGAWRERALGTDTTTYDDSCTCTLCAHLPKPLTRSLADYDWRRSDGQPLSVKTWPFRKELDSVLTGGWVWTRKMNDSDRDLGLRFRHQDDILVLHEYKRVEAAIEVSETARVVRQRLAEDRTTNGARALICGLYAAYKRSVDEYWLKQHVAGAVALPQETPLDKAAYTLLQLMDCLFWHVSPDAELWQEEHLAALVLCRVLNDMTDARADAVTGEASNFWLSAMSTHEKAMYGACVVALIKYGCMPEAHGLLWNTWLMGTTVVWEGLTGRHALWFDGITSGLPPLEGCLLCGIEPNACAGLLTAGVTLRAGCSPAVDRLGERAALLAARCREQHPQVWRMFERELAVFEALHGEWHGDVDIVWEILRRTYIAAVAAALAGGEGAREVQTDSGRVGAELFHTLHRPPTWKEDTALLAYMFGCAHPHFLWNAQGFAPTAVGGDWLDG
ncbi:hypothetical protein JW592_16835 [Streptomyces sp. DW4-2]|uniref:Uncharacterized protein n=1 Tax=Streptomyces spirodelae TaxID=2812904 RepID=A0ABS3WWD2_9ACTN|nr:hypothetical protein [Streptomyces spirodelae]